MMNTKSQPKTAAETQPLAKRESAVRKKPSASPSPREPNKTEKVLSLLKRPEGATLADLVKATGWLPHTTRAALTGLKKKGYVVQRRKIDGASRYLLVQAVS